MLNVWYCMLLLWSVAMCYAKSPFIWKSTRWCGYGSMPNNSSNDNTFLKSASLTKNETKSLEINENVDSCCKVHDHCEHYIIRWKRKYHLTNWRPFTISSCACDRKFLKCLKDDNSLSAQDIERIYFDILEVPCFNIELRDARVCVERTWFMACKKFAMKTEFYAVFGTVSSTTDKIDKT